MEIHRIDALLVVNHVGGALCDVRIGVRTQSRTIVGKLSTKEMRHDRDHSNLYRLIDETAESHQPIIIMGKRNKAVLVSEEDWSAIQETLYLLSASSMRESIREGMDTPVDECDEELDW